MAQEGFKKFQKNMKSQKAAKKCLKNTPKNSNLLLKRPKKGLKSAQKLC